MTAPLKPQHDLDALKQREPAFVVHRNIHPWTQVHPTAEIDETAEVAAFCVIGANVRIGAHTRVWAGANILADVNIGDWCSIGAGSEIGRGSTIGLRSRIGSHVFLPSHTLVGKSVFIGPAVSCTDDKHPKVPHPNDAPYEALPPIFEDGCAVGLGAITLPGVRIGRFARVAAGAIVAHDVPEGMMVRCEPARPHPVPAGWQAEEGQADG